MGFVIARETKQSVGMMKGCLKAFACKLTDCFATLAMTKPKVLISFTICAVVGLPFEKESRRAVVRCFHPQHERKKLASCINKNILLS